MKLLLILLLLGITLTSITVMDAYGDTTPLPAINPIETKWTNSTLSNLPNTVSYQIQGTITCKNQEIFTLTNDITMHIISDEPSLTNFIANEPFTIKYLSYHQYKPVYHGELNGFYTGLAFGKDTFGFTTVMYQERASYDIGVFCPGEPDLITQMKFYGKCDGSEFIGYSQNGMKFNGTGSKINCNYHGWHK